MARSSWLPRASSQTPVTTTLVALNVALFVIDQTTGGKLTDQYAMSPDAIGNGGEWWRLASAAFLHAGILHLAMNMLALWSIGNPLERMLGANRFISVYALAALGGSITSYYFSSVMTQSVGASGAIFGLLTAFIVVGRRAGFDVTNAIMLLVVNVAIGFSNPVIDWHAHFGGAVAGGISCYALVGSRRAAKRDENQTVIGITGLIVVMLVMYFLRTRMILSGTAY